MLKRKLSGTTKTPIPDESSQFPTLPATLTPVSDITSFHLTIPNEILKNKFFPQAPDYSGNYTKDKSDHFFKHDKGNRFLYYQNSEGKERYMKNWRFIAPEVSGRLGFFSRIGSYTNDWMQREGDKYKDISFCDFHDLGSGKGSLGSPTVLPTGTQNVRFWEPGQEGVPRRRLWNKVTINVTSSRPVQDVVLPDVRVAAGKSQAASQATPQAAPVLVEAEASQGPVRVEAEAVAKPSHPSTTEYPASHSARQGPTRSEQVPLLESSAQGGGRVKKAKRRKISKKRKTKRKTLKKRTKKRKTSKKRTKRR